MARLSRLAGLLLGISVLLPAARTPAEEKAPAVRASADAALAQAQDYLRHAAVADLLERESAKIALERSRREDVRRFAQTMIEDHAKSAEMLRTAARRDGLPPGGDARCPEQGEARRARKDSTGGFRRLLSANAGRGARERPCPAPALRQRGQEYGPERGGRSDRARRTAASGPCEAAGRGTEDRG